VPAISVISILYIHRESKKETTEFFLTDFQKKFHSHARYEFCRHTAIIKYLANFIIFVSLYIPCEIRVFTYVLL